MHIQLHDLIASRVDREADAPAVSFDGTTLSYGSLWEHAAALAAVLSEAGVSVGDRVALYLEKRLEAAIAPVATSMTRTVLVPLNPLLKSRQVGHVLRDCTAKVLLTSPDRLGLLAHELAECPSIEHVVVVGEAADDLVAARVRPWPAGEEAQVPPAHGGIDIDPAAIFYTSGSTGSPKGVVVSHRNLVTGAHSVNGYLPNTPEDRLLGVLPLSFDAGFSQLTTAFAAGAEVVLHNYLFPQDVVRTCAERTITGMTCVPPLWAQLAEQEWPTEASAGLRYFASTGGRMQRSTLDRLREIFPGASPFLMYGLTEAFRSTYLDPREVDRRPDSIGKAIPNAEILVVRDDGSRCDPGEEGELVHRGALVSLGYWNDPERTAERFRPAPRHEPGLTCPETAVWSGDRVVADEEGFLYFVGRGDEMIKTSGYRVSPSEIEEVADAITEVGDVVAFGVEDARLGQRIALVVRPASGHEIDPDALRAQLARDLPRYMVPADIHTRDELPRSPNGKFDRQALRAEIDQ